MDTVDLMEKYYGADVLKVAREVLEKIPRMDLLEKLPQITPTGEPNPVGGDGGQGQMEKVKKNIFKILKELKEKDFEEFKWHLENHRSPEDLGSIPRSDLENKNRENTVDLMEQCYGTNSVQVAVKVLIEMKNNNLAEKLSKMN
uniref:Pyrin domain-containing protein n=1 Tax=Gasterosteus aculeatus TaxID=69293 RepID=G3NAK4_GASAC